MTILKEPRKPIAARFICKHCGCEFEASIEDGECKYRNSIIRTIFWYPDYYAQCPICKMMAHTLTVKYDNGDIDTI